jgi:hypothetical protein
MNRKTKVAIIVILLVILAIAVLVIFYREGTFERNCAKQYILSDLNGTLLESTIEDDVHTCYLIYKEDGRKIGEIRIYCYPGGIEPYTELTLKGQPDQIIRGDNVTITLTGNMQFREKACSLYSEKFGFTCTAFHTGEK